MIGLSRRKRPACQVLARVEAHIGRDTVSQSCGNYRDGMRQLVDGAPPRQAFRTCAARTIGDERAPMAHDEAKGGIARGAFTLHTLRLPHKESGRASGPCAGDPCRRWALDAPACRIHPSLTTATKWEVINSLFGLFDRALHALFFLASTAPRPPRPRPAPRLASERAR
jgi:hypothetical protein